MSGPIQLLVPGLLGFLQLKNQGRNPTEFRDEVTPDFDYLRWALNVNADRYAIATAVGVFAGTGLQAFNTTPLSVPTGEWWWIRSCLLAIGAAGAGDSLTAALAVRANTTNFTSVQLLTPQISVVGAAGGTWAYTDSRDFWISPGSQFLLGVASQGGATITADGFINYTRIPL